MSGLAWFSLLRRSSVRRQAPPAFLLGLVLATTGASTAAVADDPTPPVITPRVSGKLGANNWRIDDTTVSWTVADLESGIKKTEGCDVVTVETQTKGRTITCEATNGAGDTGSYTVRIKLDRTPPTVKAALPGRSPDRKGWYNHPVHVRLAGEDSISGIASCDSVVYRGPDRARASVSGTCRDAAGHKAARTFRSVLKYDDTPPALKTHRRRSPDRYGWYTRPIRFRFSGTDGVSGIAACTRTRYAGPNSEIGRVRGSCRDVAGNVRRRVVGLKYSRPLLFPRSGMKARNGPPVLEWVRVGRATRYNVQLWRGTQKLLSRWPRETTLELERRWSFDGARQRLKAGRYVWYVWPLLPKGYGKELGHSTFVVPD